MISMTLAALCLGAGCDEQESAPSPPPRPVRTGTGIIRGIVTLTGHLPPPRPDKNVPCCNGTRSIPDETLTVDGGGHLRDVIVYLEDAPGAAPASTAPMVLDQKGCQYLPHVVVLRTGQVLRVTNNDPTPHNVHGMCEKNPAFNFAETSVGQCKDLTFARPDSFTIRCDVHPWMRAQARVFDHPWFAVTGADGSFTIGHVPPGSYTLVAWQERYGEVRLNVATKDGMTVETNPTFQSGQ